MAHDSDEGVQDRELERQGRRLADSGWKFLLPGIALAIPGLILLLLGDTGVGVALLLLAGIPGLIGIVLLVSSAVTRRSARHKSFA